MTLILTMLLYGSAAVCAIYLISDGYKTIRAYISKKIDQAVEEKTVPEKFI
ncbi:DUF1378 family protein [Erwinia tracheiphila]|uniref:DUF1378 family protein n=1 Tax=Erwinia tracheiphila TaxID=65700 RepID=A0A345CR07_9GAMM|nr:DUF1378 family protein [Erwinia tracheiphila]AXF75874.1 DUF1378 family protein [Erwinia tracheiphila]EOS96875.1 hypothetical protein ETR_00450 [Erwinia tracheiphila PSU-1]UIA85467.1 DUF1378 family protein [Erwinia tracheiphila]UIA86363.1 DUF1378 family protein [Erwinia tracheiphila]UIA93987.1 DUF1378 family protein [Erwinia tracheiphila]